MNDEERAERNRERARQRYDANKDRYRAAARARYHADKEKGKARVADWGKRNPEKRAEYNRRWREANRERHNETARNYWNRTREQSADSRKDWALRRAYGIGLVQYRAIEEEQEGRCAICGRQPDVGGRSLCVDHDHATGAVRGLLCDRCNSALGLLNDDPEVLLKAISYLTDAEERRTDAG